MPLTSKQKKEGSLMTEKMKEHKKLLEGKKGKSRYDAQSFIATNARAEKTGKKPLPYTTSAMNKWKKDNKKQLDEKDKERKRRKAYRQNVNANDHAEIKRLKAKQKEGTITKLQKEELKRLVAKHTRK